MHYIDLTKSDTFFKIFFCEHKCNNYYETEKVIDLALTGVVPVAYELMVA